METFPGIVKHGLFNVIFKLRACLNFRVHHCRRGNKYKRLALLHIRPILPAEPTELGEPCNGTHHSPLLRDYPEVCLVALGNHCKVCLQVISCQHGQPLTGIPAVSENLFHPGESTARRQTFLLRLWFRIFYTLLLAMVRL